MKLDNNTLAVILVVAIVLSVGVLFYNSGLFGISGALTTDTGTTNLTISSSLSIRFIDSESALGVGSVYAGNESAEINTESGNTNGNWTGSPPDDPMLLENDGNTDANITFSASATPDSWIGGTANGGPEFEFKIEAAPGNTSSCGGNQASSYTALSTTEIQGCENTTYTAGHNAIEINYQAFIPKDAPPEDKEVTVTAHAYTYTG